jgi:MFS transporter, SET family, sugar efflux transporter
VSGTPEEVRPSAGRGRAGGSAGPWVGLTSGAVPLAGAIGAYGVLTAFLNTTTSLFLADAVHAAPLLIGLFFAGRGTVAIVAALVAGPVSDRLPDRRVLLLISGAGGALGAVCFAVLRDYAAVLVTGAVFFSIGGIGFSQLFAYANEFAKARGRAVTAFTSVMRSVFSASWVIGPPVAFYLLTRYGFGPLYLTVAGLSLATAGVCLRLRRLPAPPRPDGHGPAARQGRPGHQGREGHQGHQGREGREGRQRRGPAAALASLSARTWLLLGAVVALGVVDQMYNIDIALYVTRTLHLGAQLVGWMAGLGAALEIPIMIVAGRFADRFGKLRVVLAGAAAAVVFFCLLPLARSAAPLLALQMLNAAWVAVVMSLPMVMVQDEVPSGAGAASALYTSAFMSASLLAGAITGVAATAIGFGNVFWVCAALSAAAAGMLLARSGAGDGRTDAPDRSG